MIVLSVVCALVVLGVCWGEAALHPDSRQGPRHALRSNSRYDVYNTLPYNMYSNQRYDVYDGLDDDLSHNVHRASPVGFHNARHAPAFVSHHTPAVFAHHTPPVTTFNAPPVNTFHAPHVTTFNAPAISSLRGSAVIPTPYLVPPKVHVTLPQHDSPDIVHKAPKPYVSPVPQPKPVIPIKSQYHVQDELGQYSFGYDAGISSRQETRDAYGTVRGSFSYIDSNGELQTQHYVAGKDGFQVRGTNLPVHVTNEGRYKRSYATFPAATGPLTKAHQFPNLSTATPYYVYGPPRRSFSYSLQSFPSISHRTYYPRLRFAPHQRYYY